MRSVARRIAAPAECADYGATRLFVINVRGLTFGIVFDAYFLVSVSQMNKVELHAHVAEMGRTDIVKAVAYQSRLD